MWVAWPIITVVILAFEGKALLNRTPGDTLSESIWWLRARIWGRLLFNPLWFWMTYHFIIEPESMNPLSGIWWDDFLVIGLGIAYALLRDFNEYNKTPRMINDGRRTRTNRANADEGGLGHGFARYLFSPQRRVRDH